MLVQPQYDPCTSVARPAAHEHNNTEAQRKKYIELRLANPSCRIRSDTQLGPRTCVQVNREREQGLEMPETYWVELSEYLKDHPTATVPPDMIVYEMIKGKKVAGAMLTCVTFH